MSLLLLAAALLGGTALALRDEDEAPAHARLAAGAVLGLAVLGLAGYAAAAALGLGAGSNGLAALVAAAPAALVPRGRWRLLRPQRPDAAPALLAAAAALLLALFFDRVFLATPEGIFTGIDHNLGDLPFHLAIVAAFTNGEPLPLGHPELSGVRLTYPFLADFGAAQLAAGGMPVRRAFLVQNLVLALALLALLYRFALRATGDRLAAGIAPLLVFSSGGLGFVLLWGEAASGAPFPASLLRLSHDYTIHRPAGLAFGNTLICQLGTQRSLLFGAPLALIVFDLLWRATSAREAEGRRRRLLLAGLATGLLPLVHAHALAVVLAVAFCLAPLHRPLGGWLAFFGPALALAVPQLSWLTRGSATRAGDFLAWQPGWESAGSNPLVFWLWNAGPFLPLLLWACLKTAPFPLARFHLPFWGLFLVPNLLRLSPWIWDNIKFLFFWLLASAPLVALVLARLLRRPGAARAAGAALLLSLTLSGGLDVWRAVSRQIRLPVFDGRATDLGAALARAMPPGSVVLRAPTHDSPALLSGRPSVLGYVGHIWSQGLDAGTREQDIERAYGGGPAAEEVLGRYGVDFILVGPQERARYRIDAGFLSRFPLALELHGYELRRVAREGR